MDAIQTEHEANVTRAAHLTEWRAQNFLLTVFIGPLIGGAAAGVLIASVIAIDRTFPFGIDAIGHGFSLVAAIAYAGMLYGFIPAIICALITNRFRGLTLSRNTRLLLAPLIGAFSVLISYGAIFIVLIGWDSVKGTVNMTGFGAFAASVCATVMEFKGRKVPTE